MLQVERVAQDHGHRLNAGSWKPISNRNQVDAYAHGATVACINPGCVAWARVLPRPYGGGIDIDGPAVTIECPLEPGI